VTRKDRLWLVGRAGFVSGLIVLGVGGRVAMRVLAFLTLEESNVTLFGTLGIIAAGAAWGFLTAPGLLLLGTEGDPKRSGSVGVLFGLFVLVPATLLFGAFSGFEGPIVAPRSFIVASSVVFPALFVVHGLLVVRLEARWSAS